MGVEGPPGGKERHGGRWDTALCRKGSGNLGTVAEDKNFIGGGFPLRN